MSEPINPEEPIKKKRGRKKKSDLAPENVSTSIEEIQEVVVTTAKKRGRKPKGGKIIQQITNNNMQIEDKPNVILHLKCSMKDLNVTTQHNYVESYNFFRINRYYFCFGIPYLHNQNVQRKWKFYYLPSFFSDC